MNSLKKDSSAEKESRGRIFLDSIYRTLGASVVLIPLGYFLIDNIRGPLTHSEYIKSVVSSLLDKECTPQKRASEVENVNKSP